MENLIFLFATSFVLRLSSTPRIKNYLIGDTGCSALLSDSGNFEKVETKSGDQLYFTEFHEDGATYGIICALLKQHYGLDEAHALLGNYINKIRKPYFILHNTGLQKCTDWNTHASVSVVDYWQDIDQVDWKIKGYTNGEIMALLYVKNINRVAVKKQDKFLDSFHFKGIR